MALKLLPENRTQIALEFLLYFTTDQYLKLKLSFAITAWREFRGVNWKKPLKLFFPINNWSEINFVLRVYFLADYWWIESRLVLPATHKYQVTLLINNFVNKEHIYTLLKIKSPSTVGMVVEEEVRCEWLAGWMAGYWWYRR